MPRVPEPLPGPLANTAFHVRDADRSGVSRHRLRTADLAAPLRGIRMPALLADSLEARCRAVLAHRPDDLLFSHTTAATLMGVPLPRRLQSGQPIHVSVPGSVRAPQIDGVLGHAIGRWQPWSHRGLPVTRPEQTWLDLAAMLGRDELVAVGDYLVSARHPLTTPAALAAIVELSPGRRGIRRARECIRLVRPGSESPAETALRLVLSDAGMPPPELNYRIHARGGHFVARVDIAYPDQRVALESEGDYHRVDRDVWHRDIRRRERLEDLGWRVVRVTAADLRRPADLVSRVQTLLFGA